MTKIDFEKIKKYGSKNLQYFFKTNQNVFGVTDRVFNKTKKLVDLVEGLGGVQLVNVTGDCGKNNTMLLEFSNTVSIVQMYVNSNYISVGNNPHFGQYYFNMYLKVGSSHLNEVVDFIRNYFIK